MPKSARMSEAEAVAWARKRFAYDRETGRLTYREATRKNPIGSEAGTLSNKGYLIVKVSRLTQTVQRVVWLIVHGKFPRRMIDHRDANRLNNRLSNLREATNGQNRANSRPASKSGYKGAYITPSGAYAAATHFDGARKHLGTFPTAAEANAAYLREARLRFGDYVREADASPREHQTGTLRPGAGKGQDRDRGLPSGGLRGQGCFMLEGGVEAPARD